LGTTTVTIINMKTRLTKIALCLILTLGLNLSPVIVHAAGANITLVANRATVSAGGSLIVAIYMNGGGTPIYGVQSDLNFPSSKLQYVGFSAGSSAFEIAAANGGGDGSATIARGTTNPVSGVGLIGTVTFKALASSGSATISVAGSSSLSDGSGTAQPFSPGSATVNFGAVAAAPAATAPAAAAPIVEAPKDTTPPTISAIAAKQVTPYAAHIVWTTNENSDSVVEYGLDGTYGLGASVGSQTMTHDVALSSAFLTPKTTLHYRVKSADAAGNIQVSPDQTLVLPGVPVTVVVRSADGQPQVGAIVTVDNETGITDQNGSVTLESGIGNKKISTSFNGVTLIKPITVAKGAKKLPPYQLALSRSPTNKYMFSTAALAVAVLILLGIDSVVFGSKYFAKAFRIRVHQGAAPDADAGTAPSEELFAPTLPVVVQEAPQADTADVRSSHFTTVRPRDLQEPADGGLNIEAAANIPLSQLVNNIPRPTEMVAASVQAEPIRTPVTIREFTSPRGDALAPVKKVIIDEPVDPDEPVVTAKKPAAPKKSVRRAKKKLVKSKTA
jgi:hypothetical protein